MSFVAKFGVFLIEFFHPERKRLAVFVESGLRLDQLRFQQLQFPPDGLDLLPIGSDVRFFGLNPGKVRFNPRFLGLKFCVLRFDFRLLQREPCALGGHLAAFTFHFTSSGRQLGLIRFKFFTLLAEQLALTLKFLAGRCQLALCFVEALPVRFQFLLVGAELSLADFQILASCVEFFGFEFEELAIFPELLLATLQLRREFLKLLFLFCDLRGLLFELCLFVFDFEPGRFEQLLLGFKLPKLFGQLLLTSSQFGPLRIELRPFLTEGGDIDFVSCLFIEKRLPVVVECLPRF